MFFLHNDTSLSNLLNTYGGTSYEFILGIARKISTVLLANGWTHYASSNGTSVSTSANLLPTALQNFDNMYSWITLKSPANIISGGSGYIWLTIATDPNYYYGVTLIMHRVEPTVSSNPSAPPTSSGQCVNANQRINSFDYGNVGIGNWYFNMAVWTNGCFYAVIGKAGEGRFRYQLGLYPLSDIYYNHPYPVCFRVSSRSQNQAMDYDNLDYLNGWNVDGSPATGQNNTAFRIMYMSGNGFVVGAGCAAFGDIGGNNLHSKLYVYNLNSGSVQIMGKLGAESYDFGITGCTALPAGSVDASSPRHNFYDRLLLPANAVMLS